MNILGLNCFGHDSAAALMTDGTVRIAVEEERLTRQKYFGDFPSRSIQACLAHAGLRLGDLAHVGYSWDPGITYRKAPGFALRHLTKLPRLLRDRHRWSMEENMGMANYLWAIHTLPRRLRATFPWEPRARFRFHHIEHHACHAASAFYCSGFDEAAIMTVDGAGEWDTTVLSRGAGNRITPLVRVGTPYSLGAFYKAIARHLGLGSLEGPGKLMGLSAYGDRSARAYRDLARIFRLTGDGGFEIDMRYFSYHYDFRRGVTPRFVETFGPPNAEGRGWTQQQLDLAAAAQRVLEEAFVHMARSLHATTRSKNLCVAGGVGLNSVANGRLLTETPFERLFIQPAAHDSGTSLGAALHIEHAVLGRPRRFVMRDAFLGVEYSNRDYERAIAARALPSLARPDYAAVASRQLARGKILGWFQGRAAFGPRALGHRSILANPCLPSMQDVLNARVKHRESFRPFAPVVLEHECGRYFDRSEPTPFMLSVYQVRAEMRATIPAVTHVDGSARVQTVNQDENPEMCSLLRAFQRESGVPVLINTSFNVQGEPIVYSPDDAIRTFLQTDIDYLFIGHHVVAKTDASLRELCTA